LNRFEHFFEARWKLLNRVLWAFDNETVAGPGRADPFNSIRDILFAENFRVPMNSPVSIPHLFGLDRYQWIHWDGNTTTKLGRNIAQAVALGADYDPKSGKSSVNVKALHDLETAARLMKAPAWPEDILGPIDRSLAERGKTLFTAECARCHSSEAIYSVQEIGTDPLRTANFGAMLGTTPFPEALGKLVATMTKAALDLAEAPPADRARLEPESGVWRSTGGYIARTLDGIWSTPPFLHTGAVPTLYDLLLPASRRPAKFVISGRDFDPKKVGLQLTPDAVGWTFDSSQPGNGNQGHEFGTSLSDPDRWALIEYLKTL
jgi:mono/diheme cytochrome c family protein